MTLTVLKHEAIHTGYFIKHKALVKAEGWNKNKQDLVDFISEKVGYCPLRYGVYSHKISKSTKPDEYVAVWETGTLG